MSVAADPGWTALVERHPPDACASTPFVPKGVRAVATAVAPAPRVRSLVFPLPAEGVPHRAEHNLHGCSCRGKLGRDDGTAGLRHGSRRTLPKPGVLRYIQFAIRGVGRLSWQHS